MDGVARKRRYLSYYTETGDGVQVCEIHKIEGIG